MQTATVLDEYTISRANLSIKPHAQVNPRPTLRVISDTGVNACTTQNTPTALDLRAMYPEPGGRA